MPRTTNDSEHLEISGRALGTPARTQAMIDRASRPTFRDPLENFRKVMARSAMPLVRPNVAPGIAALTGGQVAPGIAALTRPQTRGLTAQLVDPKLAPGIAALTRPQTRGLAAQLVGPKVAPVIAASTRPQTRGLAAQLVGPKVAPVIAALTRPQTRGLVAQLARQNSMTSAMESMRKASEGYAATTRALEPLRMPGLTLMDAVKAFDADSTADELDTREAIRPLPIVRNHAADLVRLEHEAAEERQRERLEEVAHRRQSLAVQVAMRDALIASEEARAADAEAAAKREIALLDRALAAEARAEASDSREATMLKLTTVSVAIGGVSLLVAIAAVIVTIVIAS